MIIFSYFLFAGLIGRALAHSWVEQVQLIEDGELVGDMGYIRNYIPRDRPGGQDLQYLVPTGGRSYVDETDFLCSPKQRKKSQTSGFPRLKASPGDYVAIKYQENGHVTKLMFADPGKENSGLNFIYATTMPVPDEKLVNVFNWTLDSSLEQGRLLTTNDFDDSRCYEANDSPRSQMRSTATPNGGGNLWCQSNFQIPPEIKPRTVLSVFWVWDWPTPGVKDQVYTSCMDINIVEKVRFSKGKSRFALTQQDQNPSVVSNWEDRAHNSTMIARNRYASGDNEAPLPLIQIPGSSSISSSDSSPEPSTSPSPSPSPSPIPDPSSSPANGEDDKTGTTITSRRPRPSRKPRPRTRTTSSGGDEKARTTDGTRRKAQVGKPSAAPATEVASTTTRRAGERTQTSSVAGVTRAGSATKVTSTSVDTTETSTQPRRATGASKGGRRVQNKAKGGAGRKPQAVQLEPADQRPNEGSGVEATETAKQTESEATGSASAGGASSEAKDSKATSAVESQPVGSPLKDQSTIAATGKVASSGNDGAATSSSGSADATPSTLASAAATPSTPASVEATRSTPVSATATRSTSASTTTASPVGDIGTPRANTGPIKNFPVGQEDALVIGLSGMSRRRGRSSRISSSAATPRMTTIYAANSTREE